MAKSKRTQARPPAAAVGRNLPSHGVGDTMGATFAPRSYGHLDNTAGWGRVGAP
jgi:hypothetical protein